jgi:hypothetical protein
MAEKRKRRPPIPRNLTPEETRRIFTPATFQRAIHAVLDQWENHGVETIELLNVLLFTAVESSAHEEIPLDMTIRHVRDAFAIGVQHHTECLKHEHEPSAIACAHANEAPNVCPCPVWCYCKTHTCAGDPHVN